MFDLNPLLSTIFLQNDRQVLKLKHIRESVALKPFTTNYFCQHDSSQKLLTLSPKLNRNLILEKSHRGLKTKYLGQTVALEPVENPILSIPPKITLA